MSCVMWPWRSLTNLIIIVFLQQSADDVSQFDSKFTSQTPVDSPDDSMLSESANQVFLVCNWCLLLCEGTNRWW